MYYAFYHEIGFVYYLVAVHWLCTRVFGANERRAKGVQITICRKHDTTGISFTNEEGMRTPLILVLSYIFAERF